MIFFNFFFLFRFLFFFFFSFSFSLHSRHRKKQGRLEERGRREEENEKEKKKVTIRMKVKKNKKVVAVKSSDFFFLFFFARAFLSGSFSLIFQRWQKKEGTVVVTRVESRQQCFFNFLAWGPRVCGHRKKKKSQRNLPPFIANHPHEGKREMEREKEKVKRKKGTSLCLFLPPRRKKKVKKGTDRGNCFSFLGSLRHKN